uniref:NAC047 n=1 Tax=Arundo donax TaxID=35708 RepID=A0A0A9E3D7_ARUDO
MNTKWKMKIWFLLVSQRMLMCSAKFSRKAALVRGLGSNMGLHLMKMNGILQMLKLQCFL